MRSSSIFAFVQPSPSVSENELSAATSIDHRDPGSHKLYMCGQNLRLIGRLPPMLRAAMSVTT